MAVCTVLLSGPSGCGKTLLLEEVAAQFNMNIVKVMNEIDYLQYLGGCLKHIT